MKVSKAYSYDDVLLMPRYSTLDGRHQVKTVTVVGGLRLELPIFSAPMDTVTEANMATYMYEMGGLGVIHRYNSINDQFSQVKWVKEVGSRCGAAIGATGDAYERAEALIEAGVDMIVMDVAHGHSSNAISTAEKIKSNYQRIPLMSPNIATTDAAADWLCADAYRVGVGPGSACTTRMVAGVGVPQLSAISDIAECAFGASIVADGGIRSSGDAVKALAAGADAVMLGGLLAPFEIAAGRKKYIQSSENSEINDIFVVKGEAIKRTVTLKQFRGMASDSALASYKRGERYVVEGEEFWVPVRYDFKEFIAEFRDGLQTGMAYLGAEDIDELRGVAKFIEVTPAGYAEGTPHFRRDIDGEGQYQTSQ